MSDQQHSRSPTNGAEAVAAIHAFLATQARGRQCDWERLFGEFDRVFDQLRSAPLLQMDPVTRACLRRMGATQDLQEYDYELELLRLRVAELIGEAGAPVSVPRVALGPGPSTSRRVLRL